MPSLNKRWGIPAIVAAALVIAASARAGQVSIDHSSSVTYYSSGDIVGDYFGTFQGIVPSGGGDSFDQIFGVPGSNDDVLVSLFSYIEDPEPLPIFDGVLGIDSSLLVQGTNGGGRGGLYNYNMFYGPGEGLSENISWDLSGDSLSGGSDWNGTWSVTWTITDYAGSGSSDTPSSYTLLALPDAPNTGLLMGASLASLALLGCLSLRKRRGT
jgi:hypothetical protein